MLYQLVKKIKRKFFPSDFRAILLSKMPKNAVCVEVGSWQGDFSKKILDTTSPKKLYLVDPYKFIPEYKRAMFGGDTGGQEAMDAIYASVVTRFQKEIDNGQLEIKRGFSTAMLETFEDHTLDWIYIDGNHMYEFVKADLDLAWRKVKIGGFITGDDYNARGWWEDGVTKAVNEFIVLKKDATDKFTVLDSQFLFRKLK